MKGSKRFSVSESAPEPDVSDAAFRNKRIISGSCIDGRAEPSSQQQQQSIVTLNPQRAESSVRHVRALNTQFASWVQDQLKNHPDELWEDGVRDYLAHASNIMEKFSDVVNWLKAKSVKGGTAVESLTAGKKSVSEIKNSSESKLFQGKTTLVPPSSTSTNTSFNASWKSGVFSNNQTSGGVFSSSQGSGGASSGSQSSGGAFSSSHSSGAGGVFSNSQSSSIFSGNQTSGLFSSSQSTGLFSKSQSSGFFSNSLTSAVSSSNQTPGMLSSGQSLGVSFTNQNTGLFSNNSHSSALSSSSQNSGLFSFSNNQSIGATTFSFGGQNSTPTNHNASDDIDDENELEQPSSPSVKKSEEKGIVVVHEVKCKLYVKSSDASDKDTWKDKGMGQLSIKCKEGVSKGTKESKPTIVVRNDAGRVVLNALLYPGIKTNLQKNSLVAIFHTTGDDGGNNDSVVARTFLIRMKTEEDRNKLATAIKEYSPES